MTNVTDIHRGRPLPLASTVLSILPSRKLYDRVTRSMLPRASSDFSSKQIRCHLPRRPTPTTPGQLVTDEEPAKIISFATDGGERSAVQIFMETRNIKESVLVGLPSPRPSVSRDFASATRGWRLLRTPGLTCIGVNLCLEKFT